MSPKVSIVVLEPGLEGRLLAVAAGVRPGIGALGIGARFGAARLGMYGAISGLHARPRTPRAPPTP